MDSVFSIMLDVAGLVSRGSDVARMDARIARERRSIAAASAPATSDRPLAAAQAAAGTPLHRRRWLEIAFAPRG